jgi:hypothetical protein
MVFYVMNSLFKDYQSKTARRSNSIQNSTTARSVPHTVKDFALLTHHVQLHNAEHSRYLDNVP